MSKRVALVTGGTRGIGLGVALSLAREGFDLAICGRRQRDEVTEATTAVSSLGARTRYYQCDVAETRSREEMLEALKQDWRRLDILVNNAGVAPVKRADILEASEDSFERVVRVNLQGPYFLTRSVAKWMIALRRQEADFRGCVVNISSISATVASPSRGEYCISKAGISMATQLWAVRLAEFGISVYEVRPGLIRTDMTKAVQEQYDQMIDDGLLLQSRWGTPEDVGRTVASLARGDLPYSTGSVILVDGGLTVPRL